MVRKFGRIAAVGWSVAAAAALVACGGGGNGSEPAGSSPAAPVATPDRTSAASLAAEVTIAEYQAFRAVPLLPAIDALPSDAAQVAAAQANRSSAVASLRADLQGRSSALPTNLVVVPPLVDAGLRTAAAAAHGDTLAQLAAAFDLAPTRFVSTPQTGRVETTLWGDQGHRFASAFLITIDAMRDAPQPPAWSAFEAGFRSGAAPTDAALAASLKTASPELGLGSFRSAANIRLLVVHSLGVQVPWSETTAFDGIFERQPRDLWRMPMLRLRSGVSRLAGTDFTADWVGAGETRLLTLRPRTGTLLEFASTRLGGALDEAIRAMQGGAAASPTTPGEIVLPSGDFALRHQADAPLRRAGVSRVFEETQADLRRLDHLGGVYLDAVSPSVRLAIGPGGARLQAAYAQAFTWSPNNPYFGANPIGSGSDLWNPQLGTCVWPQPDLRSFFLALVDDRGWLVSLAAVDVLPGAVVQPVCSGFQVGGS